ncbi:MAG: hypothetical protein LAO05_06205 [Acidobacteriia bacterium]|nr:hypothetical protein [Terriglobia bacterium]
MSSPAMSDGVRGKRGVCLACQHPKRAALDAALAAGDTLSFLSAKFGISRSAIHRHKTQHLLEAIAAEVPTAAVEAWNGFLTRLHKHDERAEKLFAEAEDIMRKARRRKDNATALQAHAAARAALAELRAAMELSAKLGGQLRAGTTVNVAVLAAESGGALVERLSRLIAGAQARLPAGEPEREPEAAGGDAPPPIETTAELVTAEPVS